MKNSKKIILLLLVFGVAIAGILAAASLLKSDSSAGSFLA
jgi:hypothetical protein